MRRMFAGAMIACACFCTAFAAEHVLHVPSGETKTVAEFGIEWQSGDVLKKTGGGTLEAIEQQNAINILIEEGVYDVPGTAIHHKKGRIDVKNGATLSMRPTTVTIFKEYPWEVYFEGHGSRQGDNLGAIVVYGSYMGTIFQQYLKITMLGDATIHTADTMNAIFSGNSHWIGDCVLFDMNAHTLTLTAKNSTSQFRPRYGLKIAKPGPFVVDGCTFARQKDTTNIVDYLIPRITVKNGGRLEADKTENLWGKVRKFDFEAGTGMKFIQHGHESGIKLAMKELEGPASVRNMEEIEVSDVFTVRAGDLLAGNHFAATCKLVFSPGSKLNVSGASAFGNLAAMSGTRYVVASAEGGIEGMPELAGTAAKVFTIEKNGNNIEIVVKSGIGMQTLALLPGEENATANTAYIAGLALTSGSGWVLPVGEYWFTGGEIDLSSKTAANVHIAAPDGETCVLHAAIKLGDGTPGLTLANVTFKNIDTPAIYATGTAGLNVENCTLVGVKGLHGEARVPYVLENVSDFRLANPTYDTDTAVSPLWTDTAFITGGSQTADSRVRAGEIVCYVPEDAIGTWQFIRDQNHIEESGWAGKVVRKTGRGVMDHKTDLAAKGIDRVIVAEGKYIVRNDVELGTAKTDVNVLDGATLQLAGTTQVNPDLDSRALRISGSGSPGEKGALVVSDFHSWKKIQSPCFVLTGDTVFHDTIGSYLTGHFLQGSLYSNGHTLTLRGGTFRFGRYIFWYGGGNVIADGVDITASCCKNENTEPRMGAGSGFHASDGKTPLLTLKNGASLYPDTCELLNLFKNVVFEPGTKLRAKRNSDVVHQLTERKFLVFAFDTFEGAPTVSDIDLKIEAIQINRNYVARVDEFKAGTMLAAPGEVCFAEGGTVTLKAESLSAPDADYPIVTAADGITGAKPKLDSAAKAVGWRLKYSADRRTLFAGRPDGLCMIIR